ncbi:hypothetical protein [Cytobacillus oceanisediminis]|uniref:hypothetical protein n=1 Tax=Cytobacillus oceanisediminis TaxID=665099 RepID=UPI0025501BF6|nr:hypothetical protein [Cytobacillus oceanisediminis]MDK7669549.1 hypothetical protein [Cytobacillus oceanisediminis]
METIFLAQMPFSASSAIHGDHSSASGSFFGFMGALWRPFFWLWCLFRLHEGFMATILLPLVPFSAS